MIGEFILNIYTWTLVAILAGMFLLITPQRPIFPVVNAYPGDIFRQKASRDYITNAKKLLADGFAKHKGSIAVIIPNGIKTILPSSHTEWVKNNHNLDHQQLVREEYFSDYPGFEAQHMLHRPDRMLINVVKEKLSRMEKSIPVLDEHICEALKDHWTDRTSWHSLEWDRGTTGVVSRAATSIFTGPEMAANPEWQQLIQGYVRHFFAAAGELHEWPAWSRGIVQWFLPNATACRSHVRHVRAMVNQVVRDREEEKLVAERDGRKAPDYNDAIAWTHAATNGNVNAGDVQLGLAMAALFTTTEVLKQVIIDLARHPELVGPLREEIDQQISAHGLTTAALYNMELLDSVMKESQRYITALTGLERIVVQQTVLPDGTKIPKGHHLMVDSSEMWSENVHTYPEQYDGYRFLKRRRAGYNASQFVQSSTEHNTFGGGRHLCPGRFFASNELKLCLVQILRKYNIRMKHGYASKPLQVGFYVIADPNAQVEVCRRDLGRDI